MKEIIIEVPDEFGKALKPWKANAEIKSELVRCKDCKFAEEELCEIAYRFGEKDDWFCADGERKEWR